MPKRLGGIIGCQDKTSSWAVYIYGQVHRTDRASTGTAANPDRDQLNRKHIFSPHCAREFGLARQAGPSRRASARPFSITRLNLVLSHGLLSFLPVFHDGVHLYRQPPSGQSRVFRLTQLRTNGVHGREFIGTYPVVNIVRVTGAAFSGIPWTNQLTCASLFPRPCI